MHVSWEEGGGGARCVVHCIPPSNASSPLTQGMGTHLSTIGGFPPQKAGAYVHPEVPTGLVIYGAPSPPNAKRAHSHFVAVMHHQAVKSSMYWSHDSQEDFIRLLRPYYAQFCPP